MREMKTVGRQRNLSVTAIALFALWACSATAHAGFKMSHVSEVDAVHAKVVAPTARTVAVWSDNPHQEPAVPEGERAISARKLDAVVPPTNPHQRRAPQERESLQAVLSIELDVVQDETPTGLVQSDLIKAPVIASGIFRPPRSIDASSMLWLVV